MTNNELKAWLLLAGFKYNSEQHRYSYSKHGLVKLVIVKFMLLGSVRVIPVYGKNGLLHSDFSCFKRAQQYIQDLIRE